MPVSTLDIAKYVGVSRPVVSKVLNGSKTNIRISDETRSRVEAAAKELGYRPNLWAQAVSRGKTNAVGYVCYELSDMYTTGGSSLAMTATSRVLADHDRHLVFSTISETQLIERRLPPVFTSVLVDALVLDATGLMSDSVVQLAEQSPLPSMAINLRRDADCVYPDDLGGSRQATEHLLTLGHRRIAYAGTSTGEKGRIHYSIKDRREGYEQAMRSAGLVPQAVMRTRDESVMGDTEALRSAMSGPDAVTAWVCYAESTAVDLYVTAVSMGLSVPDDVSIITMKRGGAPAQGGMMRFETMLLGDPRLGRRAGDMIVRKIEQPDVPLAPVAVSFRHHPGATVAPFDR